MGRDQRAEKARRVAALEAAITPEMRRGMVARHEAAHAVVAHALGLRSEGATVNEAEAQEWSHRHGGRGANTGAHLLEGLGTPRENARVAIAGLISTHWDLAQVAKGHGERFIRRAKLSGNPEADDEAWQFWCNEAAGGDQERASRIAEETKAVVVDILNSRRSAWEAFAAALADRGRLDESEILAILGPYPEVSPETLAEREATRAKHTPQAK